MQAIIKSPAFARSLVKRAVSRPLVADRRAVLKLSKLKRPLTAFYLRSNTILQNNVRMSIRVYSGVPTWQTGMIGADLKAASSPSSSSSGIKDYEATPTATQKWLFHALSEKAKTNVESMDSYLEAGRFGYYSVVADAWYKLGKFPVSPTIHYINCIILATFILKRYDLVEEARFLPRDCGIQPDFNTHRIFLDYWLTTSDTAQIRSSFIAMSSQANRVFEDVEEAAENNETIDSLPKHLNLFQHLGFSSHPHFIDDVCKMLLIVSSDKGNATPMNRRITLEHLWTRWHCSQIKRVAPLPSIDTILANESEILNKNYTLDFEKVLHAQLPENRVEG